METKGLSPHLKQPATCPYPEPDRFSLCLSFNLSKIHFNIILPSTPWVFQVISFLQQNYTI
jgi:hypothetical protein